MPIKKSAKKYIRVSQKKLARNKTIKGVFRNALKKTRQLADTGKIEESKKWMAISIKSLDKAVQKRS